VSSGVPTTVGDWTALYSLEGTKVGALASRRDLTLRRFWEGEGEGGARNSAGVRGVLGVLGGRVLNSDSVLGVRGRASSAPVDELRIHTLAMDA
jgi:hypothetical protein